MQSAAAGLHALGGRIMLFCHGPPLLGSGWLRPREHVADYGTEREPAMFRPVSTSSKAKEEKEAAELYKRITETCAVRQVSVHLFITDGGVSSGASRGTLPSSYCDIATLSQLCKVTGGGLRFVDGATGKDGMLTSSALETLSISLNHCIVDAAANESVLKVRCSAGLRCTGYNGPGFQRTDQEIEVAACDATSTWFAELKHDTSLKDEERVHIQAALLYTTTEGQRVVRVHNLCLLASTSLPELFRIADLDCIVAANLRNASRQLMSDGVSKVRERTTDKCVEALYQYRINCAKSSPPGQLILPESLKLMPLLTVGALKSPILRPNLADAARGATPPDPRADERAFALFLLDTLSPSHIHRLIQPRFFNLGDLRAATGSSSGPGALVTGSQIHAALPAQLSLSSEHLLDEHCLLLDCNLCFYLWLGRKVPGEVLLDLFGVENAGDVSTLQLSNGGDLAHKVRLILKELRHGMPFHAPLKIISAGKKDAEEMRFLNCLIEDKTKHEMSYVDYLCAVHRKIQLRMG